MTIIISPLVSSILIISLVPRQISNNTKWMKNGKTVAGGHGQGDALNQLHKPYGFDIDDDGTLLIADKNNHRIIRWAPNAANGEIVAGGKGPGDQPDQLNEPLAVLIDRISGSLIIGDYGNRRVIRWSLDNDRKFSASGEVIISNVDSLGLAIDDEGSLYVSDCEKHEVRRYGRQDRREGVIVAGGNGQGDALNQLDRPRNIFVDADYSVYVSDRANHRVIKWKRNARKGVVVAGGQGKGNGLGQLNSPSGLFVDRMGSVYVADQCNNRLMRWLQDSKQGEVIRDGNGEVSNDNQLSRPANISWDRKGNLYVVDRNNHRIQRFDFQ